LSAFAAPGELLFCALGGAGEIGMNLNLYGYAGKWLMIDLGVTFGDDRTPGIEIIMPDIGFIEERRRDLVGLVLTHGHEDHIGAVPFLWPRWCATSCGKWRAATRPTSRRSRCPAASS
jgi:ribonuclease J